MNFSIKRHIDKKTSAIWALLLLLACASSHAQVNATIDSTRIRIGEQINYDIAVEVDSAATVLFPEGQTFMPLEVIESYPVDSNKLDSKYRLIKRYGLTQFDSGSYTIPKQKIIIEGKVFLTDSMLVEVNAVAIDTTKQKLYDIKPILGVDKGPSPWWKYLLALLLLIGIGFGIWYWRNRPLSEEEKIAMLPPYERAKLALQELEQTDYLSRNEIKSYYSELTQIIRKYLDEQVYDRSMESTTRELIDRLQLLSDGNQIDLDRDTIKNLETILQRADLVKFARLRPDPELAKLDFNTIDREIDQVKEALPEPTEEELLADQLYQEEMARKRKKKRLIIGLSSFVVILIAAYIGFGSIYGFRYVNHTVFGHPTKSLLESQEWVTSDYGAPSISLSTPLVLERRLDTLSQAFENGMQKVAFQLNQIEDAFYIGVSTTTFNQEELQAKQSNQDDQKPAIDLFQVAEAGLVRLEDLGVQNIITKNEQFITPNGQEGLKTFGTASFPDGNGDFDPGEYVLLGFTAENVLQEVVLVWKTDDPYTDELMQRVLNSVELIKPGSE